MAPRKTSLTEKRKAFCREYAKDCNGTQAAIRAGFAPSGATSVASRLLKDPLVTAEIHKRTKRLTDLSNVTVERVVAELARIGFADITAMVRVVARTVGRRTLTAVEMLPTDQLTQDQRAAIAEVSESDHGIRIKAHDKVKALEMLGRYLAMFTDRHEVLGEDGGPLVLVQAAPPAEVK